MSIEIVAPDKTALTISSTCSRCSSSSFSLDKVDQLIDKRLDDAIREELENFDIRAYEYEITDMINETLPDEKDEDEQREQVEEIVKAVLSGATISIDI